VKIPRYEIAPGATAALLLTKKFVQCDLYTFTPKVGPPMMWAVNEFPVVIPDTTWSAKGPIFLGQDGEEEQGHWGVGTDVDTWQLAIGVRSVDPLTDEEWPDRVGDIPILHAIRAGLFDQCDVQVDVAIFPEWPTQSQYPDAMYPTGVVTLFAGEMAEIEFSETMAAFSIDSYMARLSRQMPRNVYQAGCRKTLYDPGCTLSKDNFKCLGTVEAGSTRSIIRSSISAPPGSGTVALGRIVMTSGKNAGFSRTVRVATVGSPGTYQLMTPFFFPLAEGDTFEAYAGCNKARTTCAAFGNTLNFGGERFVPSPETAI